MIQRGYLARLKAKGLLKKEETKKPAVDDRKILMVDPVTKEVTKAYLTIDEAIEDGFKMPNMKGALKNGTKYKQSLWQYSE